MYNSKKIKVYIVDDSLFYGNFLEKELSKKSDIIEIVGRSFDPNDALKKIPIVKPDVVTMDVEMPVMDGIELLRRLLPIHLLPVVMVSSLNITVFDALTYGAVDFVKKPGVDEEHHNARFIDTLARKIEIASKAKCQLPKPVATKQREHSLILKKNNHNAHENKVINSTSNSTPSINASMGDGMIVIGASTGGTDAILKVLRMLPKECPPILVVQHMPMGFTAMYAKYIDKICNMNVVEASDGMKIERGNAYIAPAGDTHTQLQRRGSDYYVSCKEGEKVQGHRPSVDVLFQSVAKAAQCKTLAIIMTGMGSDGAEGLLDIKKSGGMTIGQDEQSCVVYGMPKVAYDIGGVIHQLPLESMSDKIMEFFRN